ncbi:hypothetical protein E2C01_101197 [Portunus trituberculatus]|uniref:Uncharacterized protein n=1 Tax=Portunus trituberculatus TaxID=210409 RepID=A0A5B7K536_PORTR|nr:hypothetical protein [Portunus trituberculatus]
MDYMLPLQQKPLPPPPPPPPPRTSLALSPTQLSRRCGERGMSRHSCTKKLHHLPYRKIMFILRLTEWQQRGGQPPTVEAHGTLRRLLLVTLCAEVHALS